MSNISQSSQLKCNLSACFACIIRCTCGWLAVRDMMPCRDGGRKIRHDRYLFTGDLWHDADADPLALVRTGTLRSDVGTFWLRRGDADSLEITGVGLSPVGCDLPVAHARRSCRRPARGPVYGGACRTHRAARCVWAAWDELRGGGPAAYRGRFALSYRYT